MQSVPARTQAVQLTAAAALGFAAGVAIQSAPLPEKEKPAPALTRGTWQPQLSNDDRDAIAFFLSSPGILF